jgi:SAM-dependent methyltransferase
MTITVDTPTDTNYLVPVTDSTALAAAISFMFKRFTFASGELEMPCKPEFLDQHLQLMENVLLALHQKPPLDELQTWRQILAAKLEDGKGTTNNRLVVRYESYDPLVGLTGGFQLSISLKEAELTGSQSDDREDIPSFDQQTTATGELLMPCVPSMVEQHIEQLERVLRSLHQDLSPIELEHWRQTIARNVATWFEQSSNSYVAVTYELINPQLGLEGGVQLNISPEIKSLEDHYQIWADTREGSLFGSHPDAKVMAIAAQFGNLADTPILDVGAGTGRNTLALARQGYPVDALELTHVLIEQLYTTAQTEELAIRLIQADILNPQLRLKPAYYRLVFLSEVIASHFRSPDQVRQLMVVMSEAIAPGGLLLFNLFLAVDEYEPDISTRELSQFCWSYIMTRAELRDSMAGLPLDIISDESVYNYERLHLPAEAFPPTSWFTNWATGRNLFPIIETPPVELRWIVCRKRD